ncbi:MAG: hypothetical protein AB1444_03740 [Spirochaetota bacterium]
MNTTMLSTSLLIFTTIWGLSVLLLWMRPRIEILWKIATSAIFGFYVWFFYKDLVKGYSQLEKDWYLVTIAFIKEFSALIFANMFFLWPLALIIIFYKADDIGAERLLKFMCIFTLVVWLVFTLYTFYSKQIDTFLFHTLREMIPNAQ